MTDSTEEARNLAGWLEQKNTERQKLTAKVQENAREQVLTRGITPLLIASGCDYPAGILGLAAGKLSEEFYRPAIVIRKGENISNGSCRSIPEFDMIAALNRFSDMFTQFGGHAQAAGFSIPTGKLDQLIDGLGQMAEEQLAGIELRPHLEGDTVQPSVECASSSNGIQLDESPNECLLAHALGLLAPADDLQQGVAQPALRPFRTRGPHAGR